MKTRQHVGAIGSIVVCIVGFLLFEISPALGQTATESDRLHGIDHSVAVVRVLNKMVAKTRDLKIPVGSTPYNDAESPLSFVVRACRKLPPTLRSEVAVYIEIEDRSRQTQTPFSGWMLASAPALSAMEHPFYDVWILDCL